MYLDDCAILVTCDVFFRVVQKYLLGGYLNILALVNLKHSDFINNHKDKISYLMQLGLCYPRILIVVSQQSLHRGEKKRP